MKTIAVIGLGHFGKMVTRVLLQHTTTSVRLLSTQADIIHHPRLKLITITELNQADLVIPCVPISAFDQWMQKISPHLKPSAMVMDVCSVKEMPVNSMRKWLPKQVRLVASHPLFGPESVHKNGGLKNLPIVLWPVRCDKSDFLAIKNGCEKLGLNVITMSPRDHDRWSAQSQAVAFLIGTLLERMSLSATPIDTFGFKLLLELKDTFTGQDTDQLFFDLQLHNNFTPAMWQNWQAQTQSLFTELSSQFKKKQYRVQ